MPFQISLAAARVNANMTQEDVAKELQVGKQTVGIEVQGINMIYRELAMNTRRILTHGEVHTRAKLFFIDH